VLKKFKRFKGQLQRKTGVAKNETWLTNCTESWKQRGPLSFAKRTG